MCRLRFLLFLLYPYCCPAPSVQAQSYHFLYRSARYDTLFRDSVLAVPPAIDSLLGYYEQRLQQQLEDTIACTALPLTKAQPESTLGNLLADALLLRARQQDASVVAALLSYGSIGTDFIASGPLTRRMACQLLPHNDLALILELNGQLLQQLCDTIASHKGWPVSGISFVIDSNRATRIRIAGAPLNPYIRYRIACNDFVSANKLFRQQAGLFPFKKIPAGFSVITALIFYLQQQKAGENCLHSTLENRIMYAD